MISPPRAGAESPSTQAESRRALAELSLAEAAGAPARPGRSLARRAWGLLALVAVLASLVAAGVGRERVVNYGGAAQLVDFFVAAAHPRLDGRFLALTANAALTTLGYAVLGTVLSLAIGLVGGVLTAQTWWRSAGRGQRRGQRRRLAGWAAARGVLVLPRGIHEVVWGLFFLSVLGTTPIVAVLAIGIPFGAVTAKVFSEILDETDQRPYSALIASGSSRLTATAYGLLPPALPDLLSYGFYRFECAIRSAAILGLVGVGGLGFQLQLSFQTLRYPEIWTLLYALILLSAAADLWSSAVRARRAAPRRVRAASGSGPRRDRFLTGSLALVIVLVPLSAWQIGLDVSVLWAERTWQLVWQVLGDAWPPELPSGGLVELLSLCAITLAMSVLAIALAFGGGMLLAFPAANLSRLSGSSERTRVGRGARLLLVAVTRGLLIVARAIPPPVWALLLLFVLFPGILPGALALGVYTLGVLARLMAEAVENLDERPLLALRAQGASPLQVFCYGAIPPTTPRFVAYGLYRWEVTIRETVVVGVVGAGGLGLLLDRQLATFDYGGAVATLLALIVLTLLVDFTSAAVRRSLR